MNTSDIARDACRIGGLKALEFFHQRDQLTIDLKGPQDYVSEADRTVETVMIDYLKRHFPNDGFLGEESHLQLTQSNEFLREVMLTLQQFPYYQFP